MRQGLGTAGERGEDMGGQLLSYIHHKEDWARLAAIQFANRYYPFSSPAGRYLAVLAAGDSKLEVREAGLAGVKPPRTAGD